MSLIHTVDGSQKVVRRAKLRCSVGASAGACRLTPLLDVEGLVAGADSADGADGAADGAAVAAAVLLKELDSLESLESLESEETESECV